MYTYNRARRQFLKTACAAAGAAMLPYHAGNADVEAAPDGKNNRTTLAHEVRGGRDGAPADYTLRIQNSAIEVAPKRIISATTYNGQFPGPLVRLKAGRSAIVDIFNDTDTPEQLHWHGQTVPVDVDGAAEEGTPFIAAHGMRREIFTPGPAGFRFYHTHNRAGADLSAGLYSGQAGPVYIESKNDPGDYDREFFLVLKEFDPEFSRGGDMDMNFLSPARRDPALEAAGESAMKASLAKGLPHGYEVGYRTFTINGRMLGHGEPLRVKSGERVLLHILNASATEIRSLALPGHSFKIVALDGNAVPNPVEVPVVWLGTAERVSAIVVMNHPGVWVLGDLDDGDRGNGMGIVVEYAGSSGKAQWGRSPANDWDYARFGKPAAAGVSAAPLVDETIDMRFAKENAAAGGFNRWTINGLSYPMTGGMAPAQFHVTKGKRYRIRMRNASDDIHPVHLHRHSFELRRVAGRDTAGVMKDVMMLGGYQEAEVEFVADNPGLTLFHCHQQLHMDFGFMALIGYV